MDLLFDFDVEELLPRHDKALVKIAHELFNENPRSDTNELTNNVTSNDIDQLSANAKCCDSSSRSIKDPLTESRTPSDTPEDVLSNESSSKCAKKSLSKCSISNVSSPFKCQVCKKPSGQYIHYGAQTCHSCRAFFRRVAQKSGTQTYKCANKQNNCQIDSKSWSSCKACRLKKCLDVGMKMNWVYSDNERQMRNEIRLQKKLVRIQDKVAKANTLLSLNCCGPDISAKLSYESMNLCNTLTELHTGFFLAEETILRGAMANIFYGVCLPLESAKNIVRYVNQSHNSFFHHCSEYRLIRSADQKVLLRNNLRLAVKFLFISSIENRGDGVSLKNLMSCMTEKARQRKELDSVSRILSELQIIPERWQNKVFTCEERSPLVKPEKMSEYQLTVRKIQAWYTRGDGSFDLIAIYLMFFCIFYSSDQLTLLCDGHLVEEIQLKYISLLRLYLQHTYSKVSPTVALSRFAGSFSLITYIRQLVDLEL